MQDSNKGKNLAIQGLRGACAMVVFLSHALLLPISSLSSYQKTPIHLFFDGQAAVMVFIAISGFFYYKETSPSAKDYLSGLKKKAIRIYLPYSICMIIGWFLCNLGLKYNVNYFTDWGNSFWNQKVTLVELLKQISVLIPHDTHLINPPTWYIPVEVRLFIVMPIIVMVLNAHKYMRLLLIPLALLSLLGFAEYYSACAVGCMAKCVVINTSKTNQRENNKWFFSPLLLLSLFFINIKNEIHLGDNVSFWIQSIGAALLVYLLFVCGSKFFTNKVLVWLGNISYEFYLIHFIVLLAFRPLFTTAPFYIILSLLISLGSAWIINYGCDTIIKKINR